MSSVRTLLMAFAFLPWPVMAADQPLYYVFASCTGRFSAELEHTWLVGDGRSEEIELRRDHFEMLMEAITAPEQSARAMNWRIEAKYAHASLLSASLFSRDGARADWALSRAESEIAHCVSFLLDS